MKNIIKICLLMVFGMSFNALQAQTKIGYFDIDYVLPLLPETKQVDANMKVYVDQVKKEMDAKQKEYETKTKEFQEKAQAWPEAIQRTRAEEIQALEKQIGEFEQKAQTDIQNRQSQLMSPILEKVEKAIKEISTANTFSHVFRSEYCYSTNKTNNISDLVLKKLGVTPPPAKTN